MQIKYNAENLPIRINDKFRTLLPGGWGKNARNVFPSLPLHLWTKDLAIFYGIFQWGGCHLQLPRDFWDARKSYESDFILQGQENTHMLVWDFITDQEYGLRGDKDVCFPLMLFVLLAQWRLVFHTTKCLKVKQLKLQIYMWGRNLSTNLKNKLQEKFFHFKVFKETTYLPLNCY